MFVWWSVCVCFCMSIYLFVCLEKEDMQSNTLIRNDVEGHFKWLQNGKMEWRNVIGKIKRKEGKNKKRKKNERENPTDRR